MKKMTLLVLGLCVSLTLTISSGCIQSQPDQPVNVTITPDANDVPGGKPSDEQGKDWLKPNQDQSQGQIQQQTPIKQEQTTVKPESQEQIVVKPEVEKIQSKEM